MEQDWSRSLKKATPDISGTPNLSERVDYDKQFKKMKKEKSDQQRPNALATSFNAFKLKSERVVTSCSFAARLKHGCC